TTRIAVPPDLELIGTCSGKSGQVYQILSRDPSPVRSETEKGQVGCCRRNQPLRGWMLLLVGRIAPGLFNAALGDEDGVSEGQFGRLSWPLQQLLTFVWQTPVKNTREHYFSNP